MHWNIGEAAGKVYRALEANGPTSVAKLKELTKESPFVLHAAIGWLAREDKVGFEGKGRTIKVALKG